MLCYFIADYNKITEKANSYVLLCQQHLKI